jgi:two-component system sensor histidine kinase HydH
METFALAAVSLTISISLLIKKKKSPTYRAFAFLCLTLFFQKAGVFFYETFTVDTWKTVSYLGALSIPPLLISFCRIFLKRELSPSRRIILSTAAGSFFLGVLLLISGFTLPYINIIVYFYNGIAIVYCYTVLVDAIRKEPPGVERKRLIYLAIACTAAAVLSISDVLFHYGYNIAPLSDIAIAALIYFTLIVITYRRLPELHEIMVRALIIFALVLFATSTFYFVMKLFGKGSGISLNGVLMTSFIIVIFIDPVKMILKKIAGHLFFDGRSDVSTSLYTIDEEVERGKSVLLDEMATGLAHEIRNPLGAIKGAAQYLKSETESLQSRKLLTVIIEEADRLNGVMSQFLNYAKPHSIETSTQDINRIITRVVSLLRAGGLPHNIDIEEDLDANLPGIDADGEQLTQVILNMALNGIEAMSEGGTLTITTARIEDEDKKKVEISIRDTGGGIDDSHMKDIFKPFFTTKKKGAGLGLAVCQRIIKSHGGRIDLESTPGEGTAFFVRI